MPAKPRLGLLPLYIALYDKVAPDARDAFAPLLANVQAGFESRGINMTRSGICCVKPQFSEAIDLFERNDVDTIVALHLAYSPSGEAIEPLRRTQLPILVLDTTMDHAFGHDVDPARLMYNHGIHGVQDLTSMLRRRRRPYHIVAGHITESNVMDRAAGIVRAAFAARQLRSTRVLRIGDSFESMDDFAADDELAALGVHTDQIASDDLAVDVAGIMDAQVKAEIDADNARFEVAVDPDVHWRSVQLGLGLRSRLAAGDYNALSMNFLAFDSPDQTVPFLEVCKAMSCGLGYAGEGDVLTASLVGALSRAFGKTTFTEIFCPDWKGNTLFLSHMGEINPDIAAVKPIVLEKPFPYTNALNPAYLACAFQPGPAVLVNVAPAGEGALRLIAAAVDMLPDSPSDAVKSMVRGWMKPDRPVAEFLEAYSRCGGTHHSALVYGRSLEAIGAFAELAGLEYCPL